MEVNKEQAERCRDIGAQALKSGDAPKAIKMLSKSLQLYPLPGVEALLSHAKSLERNDNNPQSSKNGSSGSSAHPPHRSASTASSNTGADGRAYTDAQVDVVRQVLKAKEGGRGAHYRILSLPNNATESDIKKAYRKLSLKVHPDKNSAPHADEAFKAVGLAYATLSDSQKRHIYDQYGEEDPDNRGGAAANPFAGMRRGGGGAHMHGQEVSPEDIFNMFFGGGMAGGMGGPGVHFNVNGFGPGMQFRAARQRERAQQRNDARQRTENPGLGSLMQFLPLLVIMLVSFFNFNDGDVSRGTMPGENKYFTLTSKPPFTNPLVTQLTKVKDIPYFVSDKFLRTYHRDRYQLAQVERMVERAYEQFLLDECQRQTLYRKRLLANAQKESNPGEKQRKLKIAEEFELSRCDESYDLFPNRNKRKQSFY